MNNKLILVDADGVLLSWEYAFEKYLALSGYKKSITLDPQSTRDVCRMYGIDSDAAEYVIRSFNQSAHIGFIPPHLDSIKYVKKLHEEHGYVFTVITSMGTDPYAKKLRIMNLENLFGKHVFEDFIFLSTGSLKDEALKQYSGSECFWVDDMHKNCVTGIKYGLKSLHMTTSESVQHDEIITVTSWQDVYHLVTGN